MEKHLLVVIDLDRAAKRNEGDSATVRGGEDYTFTRDNCLEVVETFLEEHGIEMHYSYVEYIADRLMNHCDAYVLGKWLFSYV